MLYNVYMIILNENQVDEVVSLFNQGKIIAFATDTVYGLGCRYDLKSAIDKIKLAKGRDEKKPLPMMVATIKEMQQVAKIDETAEKLIKHFMPGAFTIILEKKEEVPFYVTNGFNTIGIRIPDVAFIQEVLTKLQKPMLVTSANKSDTPSLTKAQDVIDTMGCDIDAIVMGECMGDMASTIVDATNRFKVIRLGKITQEEIEGVLQ
ncbi:MAG: L-threonylcarbamoyladenylate synthase [Erysipelotrichaceae bacterium]